MAVITIWELLLKITWVYIILIIFFHTYSVVGVTVDIFIIVL